MVPHLPAAQTAPPPSPPPSLAVMATSNMSVDAVSKGDYRGTKRGSGSDASPPMSAPSPTGSTPAARPIARIRSSKRTRVRRGVSPAAADLSDSHGPDGASPARESCSSPLKRARAANSGDIHNFHILPSSDDESDMELSPRITRSRVIPPVLRPSPLHRSFSTTTRPSIPQPVIQRPATVPANTDTPVRTRARALLTKVEKVDVEDLGTELNKVFMLVHGRGLGMGSTGAARGRKSSGLRPKDQPDTPSRSTRSKDAMDQS